MHWQTVRRTSLAVAAGGTLLCLRLASADVWFSHDVTVTALAPPPFNADADPKTPPASGEEQIPANVKAWDGKKAMVTGFMLPVKLDNGLVTEFLLVKDAMMCCYGSVPNMNEWVVVKMAKGVRPLMDVPISFYGELQVGAMFENGYMTGIYSLAGERMGEVKG